MVSASRLSDMQHVRPEGGDLLHAHRARPVLKRQFPRVEDLAARKAPCIDMFIEFNALHFYNGLQLTGHSMVGEINELIT